MVIIRSFDVNKPGTDFENLQGGVVGKNNGLISFKDKCKILLNLW